MSRMGLFVVGNFLPQKNAGIENYTHWWMKNLASVIDTEVLIVNSNGGFEDYFFDDIRVKKISTYNEFTNIDLRKYLFVHFMEYSGKDGVSIRFFKHAFKFTRVYFTFHLPYFVCIRGDLRFQGTSNCESRGFGKCFNCFQVDESPMFIKLKGIKRFVYNELQMQALLKYSNRIFYYADWFFNFVGKSGLNIDKFHKVPYVSLNEIKTIKNKETKPLNRIVFVGRIEQQKGLHLLCEALKTDFDNVKLEVYGNVVDPQYYEYCRSLLQFDFLGTVSRDKLEEIIINYDILVLPSLFSEMSSMILRQAILQRMPVLVSSALGNLELVSDYKRALIFKYADSVDLGSKLNQFYQNYDYYANGVVEICKKNDNHSFILDYGIEDFNIDIELMSNK